VAKILCQHLWKIYPKGNVEGVKDVNLECRDKELLAILGPSGCGKTSTLRMIAGLESISRGTIQIGETVVNDLPPHKRNIAMAFENYGLYPHKTVFENIAYPLQLRNIASDEIQQRVKWVTDTLNIGDVLNIRPAHLSGGQRQRVSLARALVRKPEAFLMDEPISHLDAKMRAFMRVELKRLHRDTGATTVYVTHDQIEALAMADRVAIMNLGELQQVGTPDEVYNQPANEFVAGFIGEPPVNLMDCSLRTSDGKTELMVNGHAAIEITDAQRQKIERKNINSALLRLGVRPAFIQVSTVQNPEHRVPAQVYILQPLGEMALLTVRLGEYLVNIEVDPRFKVKENSQVWLGVHAEKIFLFDHNTRKSIL
jgi:multiple sugar transport system ATP-binding protein